MENFTGNNLKGHWKLSIGSNRSVLEQSLKSIPFAIVPAHYLWQLLRWEGRSQAVIFFVYEVSFTQSRRRMKEGYFYGKTNKQTNKQTQNCENPNHLERFSVTTEAADGDFRITWWRLRALTHSSNLTRPVERYPALAVSWWDTAEVPSAI